MAVSLTPPISHKTAAQQEFDDARVSHDKAMDAADVAEVQQYQQTLRAVQLYGQSILPALSATHETEGDQRTTFGLLVAVRATEKWAVRKSQTAAILQGLADSMGVTRAALCEELKTVEPPAEFESARATIAGA